MNNLQVLEDARTIALLGLQAEPESFSNRIYHTLKSKGKKVIGIHPKHKKIDGDPVYETIEQISQPLDLVVFVVNPKIGINYLDRISQLEVDTIWMQPGTVSQELLDKAQSLNLQVVQDCVLQVYK